MDKNYIRIKFYFSRIAKEVKNKLSGKHYSFPVAQRML
jgi:hypothetical protein